MIRIIVVLALLLLVSPAWAQTTNPCDATFEPKLEATCTTEKSCKVAWCGNTEPDMSHYNLYFGSASNVFDHPDSPFRIDHPSIDVPDVVVGLNLADGTYFLRLTAVDTSNIESEKSLNELTLTVNIDAPTIPINFGVIIPQP